MLKGDRDPGGEQLNSAEVTARRITHRERGASDDSVQLELGRSGQAGGTSGDDGFAVRVDACDMMGNGEGTEHVDGRKSMIEAGVSAVKEGVDEERRSMKAEGGQRNEEKRSLESGDGREDEEQAGAHKNLGRGKDHP